MRKIIVGIALIVGVPSARAQGPINITGVWGTPPEHIAKLPIPEQGKTGTAMKGAVLQTFVQTRDTLTLVGLGLTYKFAMDGSLTKNCMRSQGVCHDNMCRALLEDRVLVTTCKTGAGSDKEFIATTRYTIDANGNLVTSGLITIQGVTVTFSQTYVRQGGYVFDLGAENRLSR